MILMSYDGSDDAQAAIDHAAKLMPGAKAEVVCVWEPFVDALARSGAMGMGMAGGFTDTAEVDARSDVAALVTAEEGAQRARDAGMAAAHARSEIRHGSIGHTLLALAAELDADAIVVGSRGLGGVKSFLLGSVSHAVVQHADRAVLVVPSPEHAERRRDAAELAAAPA